MVANLIDTNTGLPASLSNNINALGYTNDVFTGKGPTTQQQQQTGTTRGVSTTSQISASTNSTPQAIAALNSLLATLQSGGSPDQQSTTAERQTEIGRTRQLQGQYSPEAASATGNALISKAIKDALLTLMPQITAASEGSGTSKGSMQALLIQQAGEKGATEGAAQAATLSAQYGGLQANFEQTLNELTKQDPNSPLAQLAQLIIGSKGIVQSTASNSTTNSTTNQSTNTATQNSGQVDYAGTVRSPSALQQSNNTITAGGTPDGGDGGSMVIASSPNSMETSYMNLLQSGSADTLFNTSNGEE